jgi:hypothetical protein
MLLPTYQCVYVYKSSRTIYLALYITNATSGPFLLCFLLFQLHGLELTA